MRRALHLAGIVAKAKRARHASAAHAKMDSMAPSHADANQMTVGAPLDTPLPAVRAEELAKEAKEAAWHALAAHARVTKAAQVSEAAAARALTKAATKAVEAEVAAAVDTAAAEAGLYS